VSERPDRPTRIDAFERDLDDLIERLTMVRKSARDLHTLAYDRKIAASERVSASGPVHFYLDQNGDMKAREAMRHLIRATKSAIGPIENATRDCIRILTAGDPPKRNRELGPRTITVAEGLAALAAQRRRQGRGEYTPEKTWPQPEMGS
jgi:hypothetical protein